MATSRQNRIPLSPVAFVFAMCYSVGLLQGSPPGDVEQALVTSFPSSAQSATLIDTHDASPSDDGSNVAADHSDATKFGPAKTGTGLIWLYQLVAALLVQFAAIASDIVSIKDRVTSIEALTRQVNTLCERVAFQENRIAALELSMRMEGDSYRRTIEELVVKIEAMEAEEDKSVLCERVALQENRIASLELSVRIEADSCRRSIEELVVKIGDIAEGDKRLDDGLKGMRESIQVTQLSVECQSARISGVKSDTARKIMMLQSDVATVRSDMDAVKLVVLPVDVSAAAAAAKEARRARILAGVVQRMEDVGIEKEIAELCPLPRGDLRAPTCVTSIQDTPAALVLPIIPTISLSSDTETEEPEAKQVVIVKEPLTRVSLNIAPLYASKIPMRYATPLPVIPTMGVGKENSSSGMVKKTTHQRTKLSKPSLVRRNSSVKEKTASDLAQFCRGPSSKTSALPKLGKSMPPVSRRLLLPNFTKHVVDGSSPDGVKAAETQKALPKTVELPAILVSPPSLNFSELTLVLDGEPQAVLPISSSLDGLEAVLQVTLDEHGSLKFPPSFDCSKYGSGLSGTTPASKAVKRNDESESIHAKGSAGVKSAKSRVKSTQASTASKCIGSNDFLTVPKPGARRSTKAKSKSLRRL